MLRAIHKSHVIESHPCGLRGVVGLGLGYATPAVFVPILVGPMGTSAKIIEIPQRVKRSLKNTKKKAFPSPNFAKKRLKNSKKGIETRNHKEASGLNKNKRTMVYMSETREYSAKKKESNLFSVLTG